MKILTCFFALSLYVATHGTLPLLSKADAIEGKWKVDLRPNPEASAYIQMLEINVSRNGSLSGRFYGSGFKKGVVNDAWPRLHFAFQTKDRNNTYFHTAFQEGEKIIGQTYCPERQFTAPWTAVRMDDK